MRSGVLHFLKTILTGSIRFKSAPRLLGRYSAGEGAGQEIKTREDAIRQLVKIAEFLESTEPTNPASLLIRRSAKLMGMSFIDLLRELAPQSLQQIELITGVQPEQTS